MLDIFNIIRNFDFILIKNLIKIIIIKYTYKFSFILQFNYLFCFFLLVLLDG